MKKCLFMMGMAALAFASCTNEEVTRMAENNTIGFDPFVNKATKADATGTNLEKFYVFGAYSATSNDYATTTTVFDNTLVSKNNGNWETDETRYWVDNVYYKFAAYADGYNDEAKWENASFTNGKLTITDYEAGANDLIFASPAEVEGSAGSTVALTFQHLLSKVKFTFTSAFPSNYKVTVSDLQASVPNKATYAEGSGWGTATDAATKEFNINAINSDLDGKTMSQTSAECYVIPQGNSSLEVTFTITVTDGGSYTKEVTRKASLASGDLSTASNSTTGLNAGNNAWTSGFAYNYTATIKPADVDSDLQDNEIKFSVDASTGVGSWTSAGNSATDITTQD